MPAPLDRPIGWRAVTHIAKVADFVGELDEFRALAQVPRVLDLSALTFGFGKRLVVCDLANDVGDLRPKCLDEVLHGSAVEPPQVVPQAILHITGLVKPLFRECFEPLLRAGPSD